MTVPAQAPGQTQRRKVLLVEETATTGGAVMSLESLVGESPARGKYEYAVALGGPGALADRLMARGFSVHIVPMQGWRWWLESWRDLAKTAASAPLQIVSLWRWMRFLRTTGSDLLHLNGNRLVEPLLAARLTRIPAIVHFRDIPSRITARFLWGSPGFYWLMNRADTWIANSDATAADIGPHARVPLATVPNGIDLAEFERRAAVPWPEARRRPFRVAMIALINRWKRYEVFVEVAEMVLRRRRDVTFSIVGKGDAAYTKELQALCHERGLGADVEFAGHIENIPAFLQTVDVLVHTADPEPFGRVFLEAMAASKPIVAFRSGGAMEIVADGQTGVLVPSGETSSMADAVIRLLEDLALRARLGSAGRRRVQVCYSVEQYRAGVIRQYDELLESR